MEASLQVLRSLRKINSKLWTFPTPTILVGGRDVWLGSLKQLDRPEAVGLLFHLVNINRNIYQFHPQTKMTKYCLI